VGGVEQADAFHLQAQRGAENGALRVERAACTPA
jgi:hypothetical protein